jgi:DNA-binding MarR family transcriptional regulator
MTEPTTDRSAASPDEHLVSEQVLIAIRRIIRAIDIQSRLLLERYGLTGPQLVVLRALAERAEVSVGELARHIHLSQATTTGVLDRLEKRGLVTRQRSALDRRRMLVRATPQAEQLLQQKPTFLQEQFLRKFDKLHDWEQMQILSSLQRMVAMMEAESIDATPMLATGEIHE